MPLLTWVMDTFSSQVKQFPFEGRRSLFLPKAIIHTDFQQQHTAAGLSANWADNPFPRTCSGPHFPNYCPRQVTGAGLKTSQPSKDRRGISKHSNFLHPSNAFAQKHIPLIYIPWHSTVFSSSSHSLFHTSCFLIPDFWLCSLQLSFPS